MLPPVLLFSKIDGEVKEVLLPGGQSTIQVPSGKQQNLNIHCQVNQGETLLVGGLPSDKTSKALYCLLTTEWVEETPK